jgi:tRNA modification GTPase
MAAPTDTIAAPATPAGASALALVRVSGPACGRLAAEILGDPPPPRHALHADYRARDGRVLDDMVATYFPGPHSFTGEDTWELSLHGNPLIVQLVMEDLFNRGCRPAEPGEFSRRAFLNGRLDLAQAEAVMEVIGARSERALAAAQRQLRGGLGRHLERLQDQLLQALAQVEAYIDFPEEDLPPEDRAAVRDGVADVLRGTQRLLATERYGDLLREGIRTVILGAPNAGKSSLLNLLVGHDRALVSPEPGTTRDYIEEYIHLGPIGLRLVDTAGLNPAPGTVERLGMAKTHERVAAADLILLVLDATLPCPPLPADLQAYLSPARTLVVLNKTDLLADAVPPAAIPPADLPAVRLSALTGDGLAALTAQITRLADALRPELGDEEVLTINARHADALRRTIQALDSALAHLEVNGPVELMASDLREALAAAGEIAGKFDNEAMLDRLFASFCIGK